ncbi:Pollen Ole e 1 allergen and extensin family protein [Salvia divinorum]|uniref:Pollen Ole e 1 allergen and extensin family protein n=1 Tax=Salvia divinorum TaxID=28513 RepID=A0ABD1G6V7_SALDI
MSWILTLILLTSTFLSEAKHHPHPLSAATVVGAVYCDDACIHQDPPKPDPFIAGATVAVECKGTSTRPPFRQEVKTGGRGEFRVDLPFSVANRAKTIRGCTAALVRSNDLACAAAGAATLAPLRLKSRNGKEQIFSAGVFSFKPQNCNRKQTGGSPEKFFLPPNPLNPGLLPPNPLLPPPSLIPPLLPTPPPSIIPPVFPTPPPSVIPPLLPTPPSSPSFPLPLPLPPFIPGLVPSPSPPPPVLPVPLPPLPVPLPPLPVPLPPLPVPPVPFLPPGIPGGPPAEVSSKP